MDQPTQELHIGNANRAGAVTGFPQIRAKQVDSREGVASNYRCKFARGSGSRW